MRYSYSHWVTAEVTKSPFDPNGNYASKPPLQARKSEVELIFFQRVGLSQSWMKTLRGDTTGGVGWEETTLQEASNLTLYAFPSRHNDINFHLGLGVGRVQYDYQVDGVSQVVKGLNDKLSLKRRFLGFEYTFERLGLRIEFVRVRAENSQGGQTVQLHQNFRFFTLYIPFN